MPLISNFPALALPTAVRSMLLALPAVCLAGATFAAGGGDSSPPKPTQTTKECKVGRIWDEDKKRCVKIKNSSLDQDGLYQTVRELAYADRLHDAQELLTLAADQHAGWVLTYWGFTHRKLGNTELANVYYEQAIDADPANHLARSYMGQGFVKEGRLGDALAQWKAIRATGGTGTWAEASLRLALETQQTQSY
ncbi:hypothetical protein [Phaeobacter sp.]|uniref:tetratricopeptide repeat protein n=1 Tax=Phaeobacter sp. TaxID=1902409 RepID=UPI0025D696E4|nr:hypothetical protein [Phaeobacter sp.]